MDQGAKNIEKPCATTAGSPTQPVRPRISKQNEALAWQYTKYISLLVMPSPAADAILNAVY